MKKYYIPTTSLNFNNILSSESVSPRAFFENRKFGYPRWFNIPENPLENSIVLHDVFGCFDIPTSDLESHPMVIEVCMVDEDIATFLQLDEHTFLCDHTVYLDPKSSRFIFFDEQHRRITLSMSDASLETKMVKLYEKRIQTVSRPVFLYTPITSCEKQELNIKAIEFDKSLNKMKGLLYGFYIGSLLSGSKELTVQLKTYHSIKNVFAAILASSDHKATSGQMEQLNALFAIVQPPIPFLERLKAILKEEPVFYAVVKAIKEEYGYIRGEFDAYGIVNRLLDAPAGSDVDNPEMKRILSAINAIESEMRTSAPRVNVLSSQLVVSDGRATHIGIEGMSEQDKDLFLLWVNNVLSSDLYSGKTSTFRADLSDNITGVTKVYFGEAWDSSLQKPLLNSIRRYVRGQAFDHQWSNDLYSSIAAVLAKGDDWQGLLQFMQQKEMFDYRIAFSFYGVLNGFANLSRDFTDILFEGDKQYTWTVYREFYGLLLARDIPDPSQAESVSFTPLADIDDLPPDDDMPDFTGGSLPLKDSPKEMSIEEDDASIPFDQFLSDIFSICPGAKKDEAIYRRLCAEYGGVNPDFAYAVYHDTKLNQGKGVQKRIRNYLEEGPKPKKEKKPKKTEPQKEDDSPNLFDGSVPSTGLFLTDFEFLVNSSEFRIMASAVKKRWVDDLRWFIEAHKPGSPEFERYYKDKPLDNETVVRQFVRLKNGAFKRTEEWLRRTYHLV